jgi:hypothetical protein
MPESYPHFMEKKDKPSYESKKVLGQMYDRVLAHPVTKHLEEAAAAASLAANNSISSTRQKQQQQLLLRWPEQLLQVPEIASSSSSLRELLPGAEQDFAVFDRELIALMNHWNVYNIGELS